ncbi:MAG: hypothetical protein Rhims3KO_16860 [Hyphomicrobiales bacterium]
MSISLALKPSPNPAFKGGQRNLVLGHTINLKCQLEGNRFDNASADQNPKTSPFAFGSLGPDGINHVGWASFR